MNIAIWSITGAAVAGLILRPFKLPEAFWAVGAALLIVALGLLPASEAAGAIMKGVDVYLFLIGMMLLSEIARREGLFDWVAGLAVNAAHGSTQRLFLMVYGVGVVITTLLSNDATAVVLTPAVLVVARRAQADPLPLLFVCAFIANAASFVLPISNPANIVLYGDHTPPLTTWVRHFALPSLAAILVTLAMLWLLQRRSLRGRCAPAVKLAPLGTGGGVALVGLCLATIVLMSMSALDISLGLPTAILGIATVALVLVPQRTSPLPLVRSISWSVLPLVAGLFVLVEALNSIGVVATLAHYLAQGARRSELGTAVAAGGLIAFGSNVVNNLPAGLLASSAISQSPLSQRIIDSLLIGVDLGPNLSVTGSLATILWLGAIRREGENVGFWKFLGMGSLVMPPALVAAIAVRLL